MSNTTLRLPRATPESQGVPSAAIEAFVDAVEAQEAGLHSLMLLRRGRVLAEGWWQPYGPQYPHMLFSLSKSFTSTAVGLAVTEGRLTLDDTVLAFFPEEAPTTVSDNLAAMRVRHLLSMSTGHGEDTMESMFNEPDGIWAKGFLAQRVSHQPGTHFVYNSGATYMLAAIVQKVTGERLLDYLGPRLLEPLGIFGATWQQSPQGIDVGGWGLSIRTEDIACFGQLYLQDGVWQGRRLLPQGWVSEATSKHINNGGPDANPDWSQGYGYQFWRCRHDAYRGDGAFGQFCVVLPQQETVLAMTSGTKDMQQILDLVWEHLLPALGPAPLQEDRAAQEALGRRLVTLALPTQPGDPTSPAAVELAGHSYRARPNERGIERVRCDFREDGATVTFSDKEGEHRIDCGYGVWRRGTTPIERGSVAASGAWTDETTYIARIYYYETPFLLTLTLRFNDGTVTLIGEQNVSFGPTSWGEVVCESEG